MATCPECHERFDDDVVDCPTDNAALLADEAFAAADKDLEPGDKVGEYEVTGKLGEGGFGAVFKAVQPLIGKNVAIKVLSRSVATATPAPAPRSATVQRSARSSESSTPWPRPTATREDSERVRAGGVLVELGLETVRGQLGGDVLAGRVALGDTNGAQREHVAARLRRADRLLRRHVLGRAENRAGMGQSVAAGILDLLARRVRLARERRDPPVEQVDLTEVAEHDVLGFDVACTTPAR